MRVDNSFVHESDSPKDPSHICAHAGISLRIGGPPLDDDFWHVKDYYDNIRQKVVALDKALGACHKLDGTLPARMCNTPMKVSLEKCGEF